MYLHAEDNIAQCQLVIKLRNFYEGFSSSAVAFIENLDKGFKPELRKQPCNTVASFLVFLCL